MNINEKKKSRGFLYQILTEIKTLLKSKFTLILAILILLGAIAAPVISLTRSNSADIMEKYYYDMDMDDIEIDGVIIKPENPIYWEIRDMTQRKEQLGETATTKADDLALVFINTMLDGYVKIADKITSYDDYRSDLTWSRRQAVISKFIYDNLDEEIDDLKEAISFYMHMEDKEFKEQYLSLSQIEVLEKIDELDQEIEKIDKIIVDDDYLQYYRYKMEESENRIKENEENIAALEKDIIESPANEEMYNYQIEDIRRNIRLIEEIDIPAYQYRIDNSIDPNSDDWRENALITRVQYQRDIIYEELKTEEEFEKEDWMRQEYKSYKAYTEKWQKDHDKKTEKIYVAQRSLETGKPDMVFIRNGTRYKKVNFLLYSLVLAVIATIIGGSIISKEYQSGTIRLLLIRPKTRTKVILSKFFAMLLISLAIFIAADIINFVSNGLAFGFSDYSYPNYTISSGDSGVNFFTYYMPKMLTCMITILFMGSFSFFLSATTRNTALSVAIPLVIFAGSLILMEYTIYSEKMQWLAYTPLAYLNLAKYFVTDTTYWNFEPVMGLGIPMMIVLSGVFMALSLIISNKRDITN